MNNPGDGTGAAGRGTKKTRLPSSRSEIVNLAEIFSEASHHDVIAEAVIRLLEWRFPKTFFMYEYRRRPLALGIHEKIEAEFKGAITREELHDGLRLYVSNTHYLISCSQAGAARIGLEGEKCGEVTEEEASYSRELVARRTEAEKE